MRTEMLAGFARLGDAVAALGADQQGAAALQTRLEEAEAAHNSEAARLRDQVADATNEAAGLRAAMAEQATGHAAEKDQRSAELHASQDACAELAGALQAASASLATEQAASAAAQQAAEVLHNPLHACGFQPHGCCRVALGA